MSTIITAGRSAVSVTSAAAVDLLSTASTGIGFTKSVGWRLAVTSTQEITVRVYVRVGANCGFVEVTGYTSTVAPGGVLTIAESEYPLVGLRVTAQATSTTATVNCDFIATSTFTN
jgi:hypothetical protein